LLAVGVLGGFTTFSAFSLDTVLMLQRGDVSMAAIYVLASVIGSVVALFAGLTLIRAVA
jgi:CrcB protein